MLRASKDDFNGIQAMKDNMLRIYAKLMSESQISNPDSVHDILKNVDPPTMEGLLSGQRFLNNSGYGGKHNRAPINTKIKENNRSFNGEVGQQGDEGINRAKAGEVGQLGPPEQAQTYFGDAVRSQFEEVGGATLDTGMIGDQVADKSLNINYHKNSLGPDSGSITEKQMHGDKPLGVPPRITNKKQWRPERVVGPPVSKRNRKRIK